MSNSPFVPLLLALAILLIASRLAGAVARKFGQPRVLGELLVGVILGPTLLDILNAPILVEGHLTETIREFAEIGVLLLMFLVGMEVNLKELASVGRVAIIAGVLGAIVPVALTIPITLLFGHTLIVGLFAGVVLAATSVSISAQVLLELGVLRTKIGSALLATAIIDDILAILLVSLTVAIASTQTVSSAATSSASAGDLLMIVVRMFAYMLIAALLSWFVLPKLLNWLEKRATLAQSYGIPVLTLALLLLFAWSAEALGGVAAITGAFICGLGCSRARDHVKHTIEEAASNIAYGFLVPIFFVDIGLGVNLRLLSLEALPLAALLLIVGIVSKVVGCGYGARLGGFNRKESIDLGVCMIARGEVGLIVASIGLAAGVFKAQDSLFVSLFLVIILTTLVTPILVRQRFQRPPATSATPAVSAAQ